MGKWATGPRRRLAKILKSQHTVTLWEYKLPGQ